MNHLDQLDHILADEDALAPSSGFAASVMEAITEQATAPAPIPFPWKLAVPGIAGVIVALFMIVRLAGSVIQNMNPNAAGADFLPRSAVYGMFTPLLHTQAVPALLALAAALLCMLLCRRLAAGGSVR